MKNPGRKGGQARVVSYPGLCSFLGLRAVGALSRLCAHGQRISCLHITQTQYLQQAGDEELHRQGIALQQTTWKVRLGHQPFGQQESMPQVGATALRQNGRQLRREALPLLRVAYFARLALSTPTQGLLSLPAWTQFPTGRGVTF